MEKSINGPDLSRMKIWVSPPDKEPRLTEIFAEGGENIKAVL